MASKFNQKVQEMERIEFLRLIDNIYKGEEHIPWYELNKNSQYAKFIGSLIKDRSIILNFFSKRDLGIKGGISGKGLPITIKILNKNDENPAMQKYTGFDSRWLVVYFGISPELENFTSIVMWPSESVVSKKCYETIFNMLKDERRTLKLEGSYYLILPNELHPQHVQEIGIKKDDEAFYNWQYFPFIKDVGETLGKPISATNYRKVLLRDRNGNLIEDYITIRVTVGAIIEIKGNELKVKVPFLNQTPHSFIFQLRYNVDARALEKDRLYYFLLIERAGEKKLEIFSIENAEQIDALAHIISFELYKRFIALVTGDEYRQYIILKDSIVGKIECKNPYDLFEICTIDKCKEMFNSYKYLIYKRIYPTRMEDSRLFSSQIDIWEFIYTTYLSPYFKINDKNKIYYSPPIFKHDLHDFLCEKILKINKTIHSYINE